MCGHIANFTNLLELDFFFQKRELNEKDFMPLAWYFCVVFLYELDFLQMYQKLVRIFIMTWKSSVNFIVWVGG